MDIGLLIDGAEKGASGGATYDRQDPFTGKLATRAAAANVADANAAVEAAALDWYRLQARPANTNSNPECCVILSVGDVLGATTHARGVCFKLSKRDKGTKLRAACASKSAPSNSSRRQLSPAV